MITEPVGRAPSSPGEVAGYKSTYDRLYRFGYHRNPDYTHAGPLCDYLLRHLEFDSVLDVGCSTGWAVGHLAAHGKAACGIDVSEVAVRKAIRLGRDVRFGSATAIPFTDRRFDVVMSTDCFEHLRPEDADTAVAEAVRVSRRYLGMSISIDRDRNRWWRLIAGQRLHLTVMPLDEWIARFLAHGGRLVFRYDLTFVIDRSG